MCLRLAFRQSVSAAVAWGEAKNRFYNIGLCPNKVSCGWEVVRGEVLEVLKFPLPAGRRWVIIAPAPADGGFFIANFHAPILGR